MIPQPITAPREIHRLSLSDRLCALAAWIEEAGAEEAIWGIDIDRDDPRISVHLRAGHGVDKLFVGRVAKVDPFGGQSEKWTVSLDFAEFWSVRETRNPRKREIQL